MGVGYPLLAKMGGNVDAQDMQLVSKLGNLVKMNPLLVGSDVNSGSQ